MTKLPRTTTRIVLGGRFVSCAGTYPSAFQPASKDAHVEDVSPQDVAWLELLEPAGEALATAVRIG
jgi:hypothetical protein